MSSPLFICIFNYGAIHLGLNHLKSLRLAGIKNYKAFVTDLPSMDAVKERDHPVEYVSPKDRHGEYGIDNLDFNTPNFNIMSYLRYKIINRLLSNGVTVWYMDIDTVVLQDLMPIYAQVSGKGADIFFQNDVNMPCTGCMLCFPNQTTIKFLHFIEQNIRNDVGDQIVVMNALKQKPDSINLGLFSTTEFPNGLLYFCDDLEDQQMVSRYNAAVIPYKNTPNKNTYFVHANWMIGNDTKIAALKKRGLWFLPN